VGAVSVPQLLCSESLAAAQEANLPSFGRAKNILLLYLQGAASQLETWDPKPDAPEGIRGKWGAISTAIPGVAICEKLPRLSRLTDRMAIIRSMTHDNSNHSNLYTLSGAIAAFVKDRPVSPEDILATMYHLKGIPEETTIPDRRKRPMKLVDNGSIIEEILVS